MKSLDTGGFAVPHKRTKKSSLPFLLGRYFLKRINWRRTPRPSIPIMKIMKNLSAKYKEERVKEVIEEYIGRCKQLDSVPNPLGFVRFATRNYLYE